MAEDFIIFGSPLIGEEEISEVTETLKSGWLSTGPKVAQFEKAFSAYIGTKYALGVNSCTAALHLSMVAAGVGRGDEILTTALTFCATVNAIIHAGGTPVLVDVDPHTLNMDTVDLNRKITNKTKAILPVHFAGRPCEMDKIIQIALNHSLMIIEDCAHAVEAEYKGKKMGSFGELGCFSFYVTKNIVTGEGGMVTTNNTDLANRIKTLALHGLSADAWKRFSDQGYKHYFVTEAGFKYNMMDLQAAIGIHQLNRVGKSWQRRKEIWTIYKNELAGLPIALPADPESNTRHAYHLFTLMIDKKKTGISRDDFLKKMTQNGVGVGVHYLSIPEHPYYQREFNWHPDKTPAATKIGRETISLPFSAKLEDTEVDRIISTVRKILN